MLKVIQAPIFFLILVLCSLCLTGCYVEDPGPYQPADRSYSVVDFDRLEIGSGMRINVEHSNFFSVSATGDRRNIEDLVVEKEGSTLVIRYRNNRQRRHNTVIEIRCPDLRAVMFSGGSDSRVSGYNGESFDVYLSGGSMCQLDAEFARLNVVLSGASYLSVRGEGDEIKADISGASSLRAFSFPANDGDILLSGASDAQVMVTGVLKVRASGASHLVYRGAPSVTSDLSGASSVHQE